MKILIATFTVAKQGGVVAYTRDMIRAFSELGHDVDLAELSPTSTTQKHYESKTREFRTGEHQRKIKFHSQAGGYEADPILGYYYNTYYGYFLPPTRRIGVYEKDALERWRALTEDVDIILWNFVPTRSSAWQSAKNVAFDFWWRFFDLPDRCSQVFLCHDAYFNVRASNVSALKDKILFIACAHLAAYHCCSEIGIPRTLLLNPRYIEEGARMPTEGMREREQDFFAAHMFKSMKHMEELIAAVPYLDDDLKVMIAGTGIEYSYMTSDTKVKSTYMCTRKRDPDLPAALDGKKSLWARAEESGMEYRGQMSSSDVIATLKRTKFAVDPSWSEHYAHYCRTHVNGFIIEAVLNGAYPVLRDYRGLAMENGEPVEVDDPLFDNLKAVIIPWNATPREFADALNEASQMSEERFRSDTIDNFELVNNLFNATDNACEILRLCKGGRELVAKELETGRDSETVRRVTREIMEDFYGIELPIEWEN